MSNRRQNANSSTHGYTNLPTETALRKGANFKWTPSSLYRSLELYDEAVKMNNYRIKDPTSFAKQFMVEKFNEEFGLDINYKFFKEKLDTLKKKYKKYRELLTSTGISVDPITSEIDASDSWWKDREACKIVHAFRRKPPHGWEIMERCFKLYNVQSQSQYSVNQRREEMMNQSATNNEDQLYQETFGGEMSDNEEPEMQENEEVYRVNINDDTRPSNEFTRTHLRHSSAAGDPIQIPGSRVQQQVRGRRGSSSQRSSIPSRVIHGSGARGSKKRQSFETTLTDTMTGFREFQRQSLQQLRQNPFDQDDYDNFDAAVKIFESMELPNDTKFYWACINEFREDAFWRKYFIDRAESTFEEKIQFLQALTGYTRDDDFVGKRLSSCKPFRSPSSSGFHSGSPSSGGNNSWGENFSWPMGSTSTCSTMGYTTRCSAMGHATRFSAMGHATRCTTLGHTTNCSAMGYTP
ncbi:hypothetical protein Bca52824_074380 [Brassica carinata]|nr:hypothetical protein Bca52824_074380 [Brassica carinata]